jgi:hypothetical protein
MIKKEPNQFTMVAIKKETKEKLSEIIKRDFPGVKMYFAVEAIIDFYDEWHNAAS